MFLLCFASSPHLCILEEKAKPTKEAQAAADAKNAKIAADTAKHAAKVMLLPLSFQAGSSCRLAVSCQLQEVLRQTVSRKVLIVSHGWSVRALADGHLVAL